MRNFSLSAAAIFILVFITFSCQKKDIEQNYLPKTNSDGELNNIIWHSNQNPPYGNGDQGAISDIISVGESWAYHMGHFIRS